MSKKIKDDLDKCDFESTSLHQIDNPEAYEEYLIARKRAKEVIDELTLGVPDPDFIRATLDNQVLVNEHIERVNRLIKENLDASSIWEFIFLSGDMRQSMTAKLNVYKKLRSDPKQKEKIKVRECWELWHKEPKRYKSKAAFARDMLSKFEALENQRVIERWCKEWESVPFRKST